MRLSFVIIFLLLGLSGFSQQKVYVFSIKEEIAPPSVLTTEKALQQADTLGADLIILRMDTYGGEVASADKIRTALLESKIPVWVLIENNAASAGAFISLACDSIFMRPGTTIGAATVVDQTGAKVGEKYQTFMRSRMRATAQQNGRDPDIAEAMVEAIKTIPGVIDSGRVLSLTVTEAIKLDFCDGEYNTVEELLIGEGIEDFKIIQHRETFVSSLMRFFMNPVVSGVLIMIIIGAIYMEFKAPGIGIATVIAVVAAVLYFIPLYLEGLAANWEIAAFVVGLILIMLEIFVFPGFGVSGVLGGTLVILSLMLSLVGVAQENPYIIPLPSADGLIRSFAIVMLALAGTIGIMVAFGQKLLHSGAFKKVEVATVQHKSQGYVAHAELPDNIIGQTGKAISTLRPTGNIEVNGKVYEAFAETGYIEKGHKVKIIGKRDFVLLVR